ncbi:GIN domain-containing protein [Marinilabilia rubra]|uniref:DUF2807 domain-containing protein n=1 Tax=Marinilabilia rubra TaxID=2162893 RepID=A0A2U2BCK3_9BACT|nr:DUF2807 domain-containing protein [Marinilabilia rubra]PWE00790.1 DUF2807 domain-containing protein [Marinilabilia rubra]
MRKYLNCLTIIFSAFLLFGCDYTDALLKDGKPVQKEVLLNNFESVDIETSVRLVLTNDTTNIAVIEGLDFIVPRLDLNQENNVLIIDSEGMIGFREKQMPILKLGVRNIKRITSNFPAKITSEDTLDFENLRIVINGRGTFTECNLNVDAGTLSLSAYGSNVGNHVFKGKAQKFNVVSEGLTSVDAFDLDAGDVTYVQKSVNTSCVRAINNLSVRMFSSGDLYYSGNPETNITMGEPLYEVELGKVIHLSE